MAKTLRNAIPLLIAAVFLAGCPKKQAPTPSDTVMGGSSLNGGDSLFPEGVGPYGAGSDVGLEPRGSNLYMDGREMIEGILAPVYFGFDQSSVEASERPKVQAAADYLMSNPGDGLLIEGHCDWYGTAEYNLTLGDRRASSVKDYLITLGVDASRIEVLSKGNLECVSGLSKDEARQDRRCDLVVLR